MLEIIFRTVIIYSLLTIGVRLMGKRQISDFQTSELVITLLIADVAAAPIGNKDEPLLDGIIPIVLLVILEIAVSLFMLKNSKFRKLVCGSPVMVIENGKLLQDKMKAMRITIEDLCVQLRIQDVFCLEDVQYCIVETNGQVSVLLKPQKRQPNAEEHGVEIEDNGIETVVVSDGKMLDNSMKLCEVSSDWVTDKLNNHNVEIKNVFIMTADKSGNYNIIEKDNNK